MFESLLGKFRPPESKAPSQVDVLPPPAPVVIPKSVRPVDPRKLVEEMGAYITKPHSVEEIGAEFAEVGGLLLKIYQEDLANFKHAIERRRKPWGGKMSLICYMNEQDGVSSAGYDIVEIADQGIEVRTEDNTLRPSGKSDEIFSGYLSSDEQSLTRLWWRETRTFDQTSDVQTILLYEAELALKDNKIVEVDIKQNIHPEKKQRPVEVIVENRLKLSSE